MKQYWMKWTAALVALVMMLTMFPVQWTASAKAEDGIGMTTADEVYLRKQPGGKSYWFKLPKGFKCTVLGTETEKGVLWYKVNSTHPTSSTDNTYIGYIHSDYFTTEVGDGAAADPVVPSSPEQEEDKDQSATTSPVRVGEIKGAPEVNFRKTASTAGDNIYQTLPEGTLVQVLEVPEVMDENHWVKVVYDGKEGYIMASYLTISTVDGDQSGSTGDTGSTGGSDSTGGSTGDTGSTGGSTTTVITVGEVNADNVNFRKEEGGALIDKVHKGTRVEILSVPAGTTSNYWYKVSYDGKVGYIQAPFITVLGTTSGSVNDFGYVKLIKSSAHLRVAPGGKVVAEWETPGETLPVTGPGQAQGGYTWYPVLYQGSYYFVRNDCVLLVSGINSGSGSSTGSNTVTPTMMGYLKTVKSGVNLRLTAGGKVIQQVKKGTVVKRMSDAVTTGGSTWYLTEVDGVRGYMRSDCVTFVNEDGSATEAPAVTTPPTTDTTSTYGYVITVKTGVNLRSKPAGSSKGQIAKGEILPMTGYSVKSGMYYWYPVRTANGLTGYVRGDCVAYCTSDGTATTEPNPGDGTVTTAPSLTTYGYVMIKSNSVNVRKTAGGSSLGQVDKNTVWPMTGYSVTAKGYTWYPINANGLIGYVRGDHSFKLSASQEESYLAGNGVPSEGSVIGGNTAVTTTQYVQTVLDDVYLRASATKDSDHLFQVKLGTVMSFDQKQTVGGSVWYRVIYENKHVWVLGDCVKVMTEQEYKDYIATNPSSTPQTQIILGYVKTTTSKVNVRVGAGSSSKLGQIDKDLIMPYSAVETAKGYTWYYASTTLGNGYLREDCVVVCDKDGNTVTDSGSTGGTTGGGSSSGLQEATYTTLKKGSKGTAVKNLVTELKKQGYYTGEITSSYTTAVYNAVKAFQAANGLEVDGIAGSKTQHKLYGTVPVGTVDSNNLSFTIYPAEKIDWFKGGIQSLWKKGASYKIYDVKTGIVWWAKRWSGAYHADIEPLTAADTARLCKIYGVSSADQINDRQHWYRRPCLVTIGTHTYAASLYGVPHNYPDGDTIADNDLKGQICLHFTNSKIHGGNSNVDENHQKAIEEAYQYAKNGDPR